MIAKKGMIMTTKPEKLGWIAVRGWVLLLGVPSRLDGGVRVCGRPAESSSARAGAVVTVRVSSDVPIFGYTLKLRAKPQAGAIGLVRIRSE